VHYNPCKAVTLPRPNQKEREVYTVEEAQKLLEILDCEKGENFKYAVFFKLAMYSGARRGELLGAEFSDFDFVNGVWEIKRSSAWHKGKGMCADKPKTKSSERCIKLPQHIVDMILTFREYQNAEKSKLGDKWIEHDRLFTTWQGKPMYPDAPTKFFKRLCKKTGLKFLGIHSWRHFAATCMVFAGTDVRTVSGVLGHSLPSTTMNMYLHSFQKAQSIATGAIATALETRRTDDGEKRESA